MSQSSLPTRVSTGTGCSRVPASGVGSSVASCVGSSVGSSVPAGSAVSAFADVVSAPPAAAPGAGSVCPRGSTAPASQAASTSTSPRPTCPTTRRPSLIALTCLPADERLLAPVAADRPQPAGLRRNLQAHVRLNGGVGVQRVDLHQVVRHDHRAPVLIAAVLLADEPELQVQPRFGGVAAGVGRGHRHQPRSAEPTSEL